MNIISREKILAAVARAMLLAEGAGGREHAIEAAAQALGIPVDLVREALAVEVPA